MVRRLGGGPNSTSTFRTPLLDGVFAGWDLYRRGLSHDGWSAEFIYRVLSPYTDPVGLALYVEPSFGKFRNEIETKNGSFLEVSHGTGTALRRRGDGYTQPRQTRITVEAFGFGSPFLAGFFKTLGPGPRDAFVITITS